MPVSCALPSSPHRAELPPALSYAVLRCAARPILVLTAPSLRVRVAATARRRKNWEDKQQRTAASQGAQRTTLQPLAGAKAGAGRGSECDKAKKDTGVRGPAPTTLQPLTRSLSYSSALLANECLNLLVYPSPASSLCCSDRKSEPEPEPAGRA